MGKGNRNRLNRLQEQVDADVSVKKTGKKESKSSKGGMIALTIVATVIVLFVIVTIVISALSSAGVFNRNRIIMKSEHYQIDANMMQYYMAYSYEQWYNTYSNYMSYLSFNTSAPWYSQAFNAGNNAAFLYYPEGAEDATWYDYFVYLTKSNATNVLIYCEQALTDPDYDATLTDEDNEAIEETVTSMRNTFDMYKSLYSQMNYSYYNNFNQYLSAVYGSGVHTKDIRNMAKLIYIGSKYYNDKSGRVLNAIKADQSAIDAYLAEHEDSYLYADYVSYAFTVTKDNVSEDDYKDEAGTLNEEAYNAAVAAAKEKFEAKKAEFETAIEKLAATKTEEEYRAVLSEYLTGVYENDDKEDTETTVEKQVEEALDKIATADRAFSTSNELGCWLFGYVYEEKSDEDTDTDTDADADADAELEKTDRAKVGQTKVITTSDSDSSYSKTVYMVTKEAAIHHTVSHDIQYALFLTTGTYGTDKLSAEDAAKALYDRFTAEGNTKKMSELLEELGYETVSAFEDEDYVEGNSGLTGFDTWIYGDEAKPGDVKILDVSYTSGSTTNEYKMVAKYEKDGHEYWWIDVVNDMNTEQMESWFEEAKKAVTIETVDKYFANIKR